jgi:hypothetical protein
MSALLPMCYLIEWLEGQGPKRNDFLGKLEPAIGLEPMTC